MKSLTIKSKFVFTALAGFAVAYSMAPNTAHATATSVVGNGNATNTLVATTTSAQASTQTGGLIATAVGSAFAEGPSGTSVANSPDGRPVGNFFNTRTLGKAAGAKSRGLGVWVQGAWTDVDNDEAGGKFSGSIFNVIAGIDYKPKKLKGKAVVGLAVAWEDVDIDTSFNAGTFEGSGVSFAPYVGYSFKKNLVVDATVGYSILDYDVRRTTAGTVTSGFDAQRVFGAVNLGGNFHKKKFRISPKIGVLGLWEEQDTYTDSAGTAVGKTRVHLGRMHAGAEIGFQVKAIEPFIGARANFDFNRNSPVTLANGNLSSDDEFGASFSAGVNLRKNNISGQIKGETNQFKNEVTTWSIAGRIRVDF